MRGVWGLLGVALAVVLAISLLSAGLLVGVANTPWGAKWLAERWLSAVIDPRVEIHGSVKLDLWPQLSIRVSDVVVPSDLQSIPTACLVGNVQQDPAALQVRSLHGVLDWQRWLERQWVIPVVSVSGVNVMHVVAATPSQATPASEWGVLLRKLLPYESRSGWLSAQRLQVDVAELENMRVQRCSPTEGLQTVYTLQQARLQWQALSDQQSQFEFSLDGLAWSTETLPPTWAELLQENGLARDGHVLLDTLRSRWQIDAELARMESLLWLGTGPTVEMVSGVVDLQQKTVDILLTLHTMGSGSMLKIPGVEIILRRSSLPLRLYGSWKAPNLQLGVE